MKVTQIVCTYPPYKGGTGKVAYNFKKFFKTLYDLDSLLLTPKYQKDYKSDDPNVIYLNTFIKFGNAAFIPQIYKYLKNSDVVIFHAPFFGAVETLLLYLFFNRKKRAKIFVYYHQDPIINYGFRKYIFNFYNKYIYPLLFKKADKILVSSLDYAENSLLKKHYLENPEKFEEIRLAVDSSEFFPVEDEALLNKIKIKYNLENGPFITFVGGLGESHYFKGVEVLLKALSILKNKNIYFEKAIFIGRGNLVDYYKTIAKSLNLEDKVLFLTNVEDDELNLFYNLSSIHVLPSLDTKGEVFGLVLVEAMIAKTAVISSDIVGVRTVNKHEYTGFRFKAGDHEDLAKYLEKLLLDEDLRKQMAEQAYNYVLKNFTWEQTVKKLKTVIDKELYESSPNQ